MDIWLEISLELDNNWRKRRERRFLHGSVRMFGLLNTTKSVQESQSCCSILAIRALLKTLQFTGLFRLLRNSPRDFRQFTNSLKKHHFRAPRETRFRGSIWFPLCSIIMKGQDVYCYVYFGWDVDDVILTLTAVNCCERDVANLLLGIIASANVMAMIV